MCLNLYCFSEIQKCMAAAMNMDAEVIKYYKEMASESINKYILEGTEYMTQQVVKLSIFLNGLHRKW